MSADVAARKAENPTATVPTELVTASGSGLDPDVSPQSALFQVPRIARVRGLTEDRLKALVTEMTAGRTFGILGEPRVNVLAINLALDAMKPYRYCDGRPMNANALRPMPCWRSPTRPAAAI